MALWCTNNGNIGVAKFRLGETQEESVKAAKDESAAWMNIWKIKTKTMTLFERGCLFMPFVFHIRIYVDRLRFCPINSWNFREESEESADWFSNDVKEDVELQADESSIKYLNDPMLVAYEALVRMHSVGIVLEDAEVKWNHVGLLPIRLGGKWSLKPIIIDLARIKILQDEEEKADSLSRQLQILKESFPRNTDGSSEF